MSQPPVNPYASPSYESQQAGADYVPEGVRLATRVERFAGAFIDNLIIMPFAFGAGALMGVTLVFVFGIDATTAAFQVAAAILGAFIGGAIFLIFHGYFLATKGQTIGKMLLKTRIVNDDGSHPDFVPLILKRYAWLWFVVNIPIVGPILALVNSLMIFRGNCKCLHDDIAGTKVIKLNA